MDTLDSPHYDPIDHLNIIFSHPATLSSARDVSTSLKAHQHALDNEISARIAQQAASDTQSLSRISSAKFDLSVLFKQIASVRTRAAETEASITAMTADIKRLDATKRNLTLSMTALKRLQMLTTAFEQLRALARSRQYKECAQLLQAVLQLMGHFKSYRSIDQIAALGRKVSDCQRELLEQVCEDFESAFAKGEISAKRGMLSEGCLVLDALGEGARMRLITWYCNSSLREYRQIFRGNDEAGSLDNISRRYAWFSRLLKTYDLEHAAIFPAHWRVNEQLANAFCESTRDDFKGILQRSARRQDGQTLDVNLLLSCLQETLDFEHGLERRFASSGRTSMDTTASSEDRGLTFEQAISEAFEPYLSLWVEAQDAQLATLIPKYRQQALRNTDEDFNPNLVIPSSTELFQFYRLTLAQCAKLSTGPRLLDLSKTFAKYLDLYSQTVLLHHLQANPPPSSQEIIIILNTADYCSNTATQLEDKIRQRIDSDQKPAVDLSSQSDAFMGVAGAAVRALVRKVETDAEQAWREMRNISWARLDSVGDQSSYVGELLRVIRVRAGEEILPLLQGAGKPQYARAFCDQLVDGLVHAYITNVVACKPISEVGAEQMLLDSYVLKKALTELPTHALPSEQQQQHRNTPQQQAYAKRVATSMAKLDPLLKTLQVRTTPAEALVQGYLIHIADRSEPNFRKILELKGLVRRQDQAPVIELFHAHKSGNAADDERLVASNPLIAGLQLGTASSISTAIDASSSGSAASTATSAPFASVAASMSTPSLVSGAGKFDPASFGSALLDRFGTGGAGTPVQGTSSVAGAVGSAGPNRVASPPSTNNAMFGAAVGESREQQTGQAAANVSENLRSIGKFFRRDMGSFPRFGRNSHDENK